MTMPQTTTARWDAEGEEMGAVDSREMGVYMCGEHKTINTTNRQLIIDAWSALWLHECRSGRPITPPLHSPALVWKSGGSFKIHIFKTPPIPHSRQLWSGISAFRHHHYYSY